MKGGIELAEKGKILNKNCWSLYIWILIRFFIFSSIHINQVFDPWSFYRTLCLLGFGKSSTVVVDHCIVLYWTWTWQNRFWSMLLLLLWRFGVSQFAEIFIRQYQFLSTGDTNKFREASRNRVSSSSPRLWSFSKS